jgi:uncharacterized SAM-binding protein YcdF (DUF218 family)
MYETVATLLRPYTLIWLFLLVGVVTLWCKRRETRGRLLLLTIPFVALHLLSTPMVAHLALGTLEWQYPPLERRPVDCEAIVVFAASILPPDEVRDQAELADNTRLRCLYAAELYRQSDACPILVSGGKVNPEDVGPPHARVMAEFLQGQGVPAADLIVEDHSRTTYENALESSRKLKERHLRKVILVADAVDMCRAVRCLTRQGIDVTAAPSYYRAKPFNFTLRALVPNAEAIENSECVWHEWLGVAWYWCQGRI